MVIVTILTVFSRSFVIFVFNFVNYNCSIGLICIVLYQKSLQFFTIFVLIQLVNFLYTNCEQSIRIQFVCSSTLYKDQNGGSYLYSCCWPQEALPRINKWKPTKKNLNNATNSRNYFHNGPKIGVDSHSSAVFSWRTKPQVASQDGSVEVLNRSPQCDNIVHRGPFHTPANAMSVDTMGTAYPIL